MPLYSSSRHGGKTIDLVLGALVLSGLTFASAVWGRSEIVAPQGAADQVAPLSADEQVREMFTHD